MMTKTSAIVLSLLLSACCLQKDKPSSPSSTSSSSVDPAPTSVSAKSRWIQLSAMGVLLFAGVTVAYLKLKKKNKQ